MRARPARETDWPRIVSRYNALIDCTPSPVIALNRAVAVGMAEGPAAGLDALDALSTGSLAALICSTACAETC